MATKFIDLDIAAGAVPEITVSDTSTVTNHVRVAWDTGISRDGLIRALNVIVKEIGNGQVYGSAFTENRTATDRAIPE